MSYAYHLEYCGADGQTRQYSSHTGNFWYNTHWVSCYHRASHWRTKECPESLNDILTAIFRRDFAKAAELRKRFAFSGNRTLPWPETGHDFSPAFDTKKSAYVWYSNHAIPRVANKAQSEFFNTILFKDKGWMKKIKAHAKRLDAAEIAATPSKKTVAATVAVEKVDPIAIGLIRRGLRSDEVPAFKEWSRQNQKSTHSKPMEDVIALWKASQIPEPTPEEVAEAKRVRREAFLRDARQQSSFRRRVLSNFDCRCAITGARLVVEAAHFEGFADGGDYSTGNGIALRRDLHWLLDHGHMGIHPKTMEVWFSNDALEEPGIRAYEGKRIAESIVPVIVPEALWAKFNEGK